MEIRRPTLADKSAVLEMMAEFRQAESETAGIWHKETVTLNYEDWLERNLDQEMGFLGVPAIQFIAVRSGRVIGFLHLRLRLTDHLLETGGHIGYAIRPSERGKGYAKQVLKLGISVAAGKGISSALLTCDASNAASRAVIVANGGCLENVLGTTERYWIETEKADEQSTTEGMDE